MYRGHELMGWGFKSWLSSFELLNSPDSNLVYSEEAAWVLRTISTWRGLKNPQPNETSVGGEGISSERFAQPRSGAPCLKRTTVAQFWKDPSTLVALRQVLAHTRGFEDELVFLLEGVVHGAQNQNSCQGGMLEVVAGGVGEGGILWRA